MKEKSLLVLVIVVVLAMSGCGKNIPTDSPQNTKVPSQTVDVNRENSSIESTINDKENNRQPEESGVLKLEEAVEISVNWNAGENSTLLTEKFTIEKSQEGAEENVFYENTVIGCNEIFGFYRKGYMEDMAQDYSRYEIYSYHLESGESTLLYETAVGRISEARASDNYLYWVENRETTYQVVQFALDTKNWECIAEYSGGAMSPCLEVSEDYVTWDEDYGDGEVKLVVWDIKQQKLKMLEEICADENIPATKFLPWSRYKIVDGYITFFTQDDSENIYINRCFLESGQTDTIPIGDKTNYKKLAGCFSNEEYIGWFTEYSVGTFYFYEMESGRLLKWELEEANPIFSFAFYDKLYVNKGSKVYVYDIDTKSTLKCSVEGQALQFRQNGEEVWIEITSKDKVGIWRVKD